MKFHQCKQELQYQKVANRFAALNMEEGDQEKYSWLERLSNMWCSYIIAVWIPIVISLIYAVAIYFCPKQGPKYPPFFGIMDPLSASRTAGIAFIKDQIFALKVLFTVSC